MYFQNKRIWICLIYDQANHVWAMRGCLHSNSTDLTCMTNKQHNILFSFEARMDKTTLNGQVTNKNNFFKLAALGKNIFDPSCDVNNFENQLWQIKWIYMTISTVHIMISFIYSSSYDKWTTQNSATKIILNLAIILFTKSLF